MKSLVFTLFLFISLSAMADLEHKEGMGAPPLKQKLSIARGCFKEINELGCGHPRDDQEFFIGCLEESKDDLTPSCQGFFEKLYGKRKST